MEKQTKKEKDIHWFVMRDLTRWNAKEPAYKKLADMEYEVFTPLRKSVKVVKGKKRTEMRPILQDLLFVHSDRDSMEKAIKRIHTLQFRYVRGGAYQEAMVVEEKEMQRFIHAVKSTQSPIYYTEQELPRDCVGKEVRIIDGALKGYEGRLVKIKGKRNKRLLIAIPQLIVAVEIDKEFIEFL